MKVHYEALGHHLDDVRHGEFFVNRARVAYERLDPSRGVGRWKRLAPTEVQELGISLDATLQGVPLSQHDKYYLRQSLGLPDDVELD